MIAEQQGSASEVSGFLFVMVFLKQKRINKKSLLFISFKIKANFFEGGYDRESLFLFNKKT